MSMPTIHTEKVANLGQRNGSLDHLDFLNSYRKGTKPKNYEENNAGNNLLYYC